MKLQVLLLAAVILFQSMTMDVFAQKNKKNRKAKGKWVQLFNGKDINDWKVKIRNHDLNDNYGNTFRVENGLLKVSYDQYDNFNRQYGHLFYKNAYSSYKFAVEYRFVGQQAKGGEGWAWRNSGIMFHCQPPESMLKNQDFPISIEVQLLGGDSTGERTTSNICTPGTQVEIDGKLMKAHCINSKSKTYRGDQWVRAEIEVYKDSLIRHIVNGDTVIVYQKPQIGGGNVDSFDPAFKKGGSYLQSGYISLQSESHPVEFRKVEIIDLDKKRSKQIRKGGRRKV